MLHCPTLLLDQVIKQEQQQQLSQVKLDMSWKSSSDPILDASSEEAIL